ncbi:MAG: hypothetical protein PHR37_01455 [Eubacteriales bacterium]|nr:hypothetical protein [Eubacteriales bacterium]
MKKVFTILLVCLLLSITISCGLAQDFDNSSKEGTSVQEVSASEKSITTKAKSTTGSTTKVPSITATRATNTSSTKKIITTTTIENTFSEVPYKIPKILKDTNLGAVLSFINYETQDRVIFSNYLGIFIYDLNESKMLRSVMPADSNL